MKQNVQHFGIRPNLFSLFLTAVLLSFCPSLHAEWSSYPGSAGISGSYNVMDESSEWNKSTIWSKEFDLNGPGNTLTFSAKCVPILGFWDGDLHVQQFVDAVGRPT